MGLVTLAAAPALASELDRVTPAFQFSERHSTTVRAAPDRVYRAIRDVTASEILFFRSLTWLRRLGRPGPESVLNAPADQTLLEVATRTTFLALVDGPRELVVGTVVIAPPNTARPSTPAEFVALSTRAGYALATMNFATHPRADGTCTVSTETRV
ncbi:MAG TPA: hypothetical protein VJP45_04415, partial [Candidatus Limnocylindria bacterium]|nr:hypothetical protein [Candidatus Limnocylindria bacterium]